MAPERPDPNDATARRPVAAPSDGAPAAVPGGGRPRWPLALAVIALVAVVAGVASGAFTTDPSATPSPSSSASVATPTGSGPATASPGPTVGPTAPATTAPTASGPVPTPHLRGAYLLMPRERLLALPTDGRAWDALVAAADSDFGRPDLSDQDRKHGVAVLAAALVYARTGVPDYEEKARLAILDAVGTERDGADNSILALGRQLGSYVLAADFIGLSGADDERFRAWLDDIRTRELAGHGRWTSLVGTHKDAPNNWGAFAGASRIAASLYLGDDADVEQAATVLRGFLGERSAWSAFQPVDGARSWACDPERYTPVNPSCERDGIDLDGAIVRDIDRGGNLRWPPGQAGVRYTMEALQGLIVQAELLTVNGFGDAWAWSDSAIRRATRIVTESGEAGRLTWNRSSVTTHLPWLLNARYDLDLPTEPAGSGRVFGYTDWLYGS